MERKYEIGQHVKYVDEFRKVHDALITIWWLPSEHYQMSDYKLDCEPGCNLLYVSDDPKRDDTYGRQIERDSSVVHKSYQPEAQGRYWCWPDEL